MCIESFQPQSHDYRWTRDHPLEQVRGNPSMPVQTRRQLATDPEMCMFALTVSIVEPKNIKEAMADSAWIEAMQDELHQFDRLKVWELVDKPFGKMIIKLKCRVSIMKNHLLQLLALEAEENLCSQPEGFVDRPRSSRKSLPSKETLYGLKQASSKSPGLPDPPVPKSSLGDKLVEAGLSKVKQNATAQCLTDAEYVCRNLQVYAQVNLDNDTASRLWLQLQQNTVVYLLRLSSVH
ncbi:hypothetical protein Tco_0527827 [Tanacetum coccineum]